MTGARCSWSAFDACRAARAAAGAGALVAPRRWFADVAPPSTDRLALVVRLLGARHVVQAALMTNRRRGRIGAAVDAVHISTLLAVAVRSRAWRRIALADAAVASALCAATLVAADRS